MGRDGWCRRAVGLVAAFACLAHANAQREPRSHPAARSVAEQKRGAATAPTHAPQPELHPLLAWRHVLAGNAAAVAANQARAPLPAPAPRPSGAGRYVCAVLVCADLDLEIAPLLGLQRADVLVLAAPGPFATPEAIAMLERTVRDERLSLVLVLGHAHCRALAARADGADDVLARRVAPLAAEAARRREALPKVLVRAQGQQLLAASELLRARAAADALRVLPALVEPRTGTLQWQHVPTDVMPIAPVK